MLHREERADPFPSQPLTPPWIRASAPRPLCVVPALRVVGCDPDTPPDAGAPDAGADAGGPVDAGLDGGADAGHDAGPERYCTEGTAEDPAPVFGGVTEAIADGSSAAIVRWAPATDIDTPSSAIRYRVYVATSGAFDFRTHAASARGTTEARVIGLDEGTNYRFVVRAEDGASQRECNEVELQATPTAITGCIDYATWIQPIFDAQCLSCHGGDESELRRGLRLASLADLRAGGQSGDVIVPCRPESSLLYLKVSEALPVQGHRMPYLGPELNESDLARIRLWLEQGASASCPETPATCADEAAPSFGGAQSATVVDGDVQICWAPGTDDVSGAADLRYATYVGPAPGAEDFRWTRLVSGAGEACTTFRGAAPGQTYCFVTRARDGAGNEESNVVERCVTVPAATCVSLSETILPMLERECVHCHGGPAPVAGLTLASHEDIMAGSSSGPVVSACNADDSLITQKVADPPLWGLRMPADGPPHLGDAEIAVIDDWIDQGARASCSDPDPCPLPSGS